MERIVWCILVFVVVGVTSDEPNLQTEHSNTTEPSALSGSDLEIILTKLESMQHQLQTLQQDLKSELSTHREETKRSTIANENRMEQLQSDHKHMRTLLKTYPGSYKSCSDVPTKSSGMYNIRGKQKEQFYSFVAYCDHSYGVGSMVIMQRINGSLSFDRNWTDYRNGFGDVDGEHWIGLENIYRITKGWLYDLYFQSYDINGESWNGDRLFAIGNEAEDYKLKRENGMKFSTSDRDNDAYVNGNCAQSSKIGWWFNNCQDAFLSKYYDLQKFPVRMILSPRN